MKTKRRKKGKKLSDLEAAWAKASKSECIRFFHTLERNRVTSEPTAIEEAFWKATRVQKVAFLRSVERSIAYLIYASGLSRRSMKSHPRS